MFLSSTNVMRGPAHSSRIKYKQQQVRNKKKRIIIMIIQPDRLLSYPAGVMVRMTARALGL